MPPPALPSPPSSCRGSCSQYAGLSSPPHPRSPLCRPGRSENRPIKYLKLSFVKHYRGTVVLSHNGVHLVELVLIHAAQFYGNMQTVNVNLKSPNSLFDTHVDGASTQAPLLEVTQVQVLFLQPCTITAPWLPLGRLHLTLDIGPWPSMLWTSRDKSKLKGTTFIL